VVVVTGRHIGALTCVICRGLEDRTLHPNAKSSWLKCTVFIYLLSICIYLFIYLFICEGLKEKNGIVTNAYTLY
jgi:hypothetical protein